MRADRLLAMLLLLQTRGKMKAEKLAEELNVSRRTILRDIEALSISGIPIYAEGGHGGGITLDEKYRTNLTGLQEEEVRTLFVASNERLFKELKLGDAADRTLLKLTAALPARHQEAVQQMRQRFLIDPGWWWQESQPPPFWEDLQQAVYEDRCIRALYENYNGEIMERVLQPHSLVAKSGTWYLVAKRNQALRIYRVNRFHSLELLAQRFQRAADFDLPSYWREHQQQFADSMTAANIVLQIHPRRLNFVRWLTPGRHQIIEPAQKMEAGEPEATATWITVQLQMESLELAKMLVFGLGAASTTL